MPLSAVSTSSSPTPPTKTGTRFNRHSPNDDRARAHHRRRHDRDQLTARRPTETSRRPARKLHRHLHDRPSVPERRRTALRRTAREPGTTATAMPRTQHQPVHHRPAGRPDRHRIRPSARGLPPHQPQPRRQVPRRRPVDRRHRDTATHAARHPRRHLPRHARAAIDHRHRQLTPEAITVGTKCLGAYARVRQVDHPAVAAHSNDSIIPRCSSRLLVSLTHGRCLARLGRGARLVALIAAAHDGFVWLSHGLRGLGTAERERLKRGVLCSK